MAQHSDVVEKTVTEGEASASVEELAKPSAEPCEKPPEFLSTIGPQREQQSDHPAVLLLRTDDPIVHMLPQEIGLDPGSQDSLTLGRHTGNEAVLSIKACSKVHCQFALRSFRLPSSPTAHRALFLRDVSKNRTLVNGKLAFKPWHWLHDGDRVGLHKSSSDLKSVLEVFEVSYRSHMKLPGDAARKPTGTDGSQEAPASAAVQKGKRRDVPEPGAALDNKVVGRVIDIHYHEEDPPATFRVRIVSYDKKKHWHGVDSKGYSVWDGESFTDEVDLRQMYEEGHVKFVDADDLDGKLAKRRRS